MSLFNELKRRNVFRVGLFYIVSAWLVVQVAETVLPMFDVPDSALRAIVIILALGFPLAVVFSWVFEMTPEGIRRDPRFVAYPDRQGVIDLWHELGPPPHPEFSSASCATRQSRRHHWPVWSTAVLNSTTRYGMVIP